MSRNKPLWEQFHSMWGKAIEHQDYNKEDWNELQRQIEELERSRLLTPAEWLELGRRFNLVNKT